MSRDHSEPSWPNAVPVSLEAGGAYRVGQTRRPHFLSLEEIKSGVNLYLAKIALHQPQLSK